jgi:hypothetical protein
LLPFLSPLPPVRLIGRRARPGTPTVEVFALLF